MSHLEVFLKLSEERSKYRFVNVFNAVEHRTGEAKLRWDFSYLTDDKRQQLHKWQEDPSYDGKLFLLHFDGDTIQVEKLGKIESEGADA